MEEYSLACSSSFACSAPVSYSSGVHHPQCAGPMTPITKKMPHEPILMSVFSYVEWTYTYTGSLQCPPGVRGQGSGVTLE